MSLSEIAVIDSSVGARPSPLAIARPESRDDGRVDREAAIAAVHDLLRALGKDSANPHLADTPRRVADAFIDMLTPREFALTTFPNDEKYEGLVLVEGIPFHSLCEHHLLPFQGTAHIGYVPGERILGLSKFARVVEFFSRDLQTQERLTTEIAGWLNRRLSPVGVGVLVEAEHMCMSVRGVRVAGSRTTTAAFHGVLDEDPRIHDEFMKLCGKI